MIEKAVGCQNSKKVTIVIAESTQFTFVIGIIPFHEDEDKPSYEKTFQFSRLWDHFAHQEWSPTERNVAQKKTLRMGFTFFDEIKLRPTE